MPGINDNDRTFDRELAERFRRMIDHDPEQDRREALERRITELARQKEQFEERARRGRKRV